MTQVCKVQTDLGLAKALMRLVSNITPNTSIISNSREGYRQYKFYRLRNEDGSCMTHLDVVNKVMKTLAYYGYYPSIDYDVRAADARSDAYSLFVRVPYEFRARGLNLNWY